MISHVIEGCLDDDDRSTKAATTLHCTHSLIRGNKLVELKAQNFFTHLHKRTYRAANVSQFNQI